MRVNTYLVHHHDSQEVQESREEEAIHVVLHVRANGLGQGVKQDLANNEGENTEADVPQRPALLQGAHNQKSLHNDVDEEEDGGENVDDHEEANGVFRVQAAPALECEQSNDKADGEHGKTADAQ